MRQLLWTSSTNSKTYKEVYENQVWFRKECSEEFEKIYLKECMARVMFQKSPWIVPIYSSGWDKESHCYYMRMPYIAGDNLMKISEQLDHTKRHKIAGQVVGAMLDIYMAGYAHCDFHAFNVLYDGKAIKVVDFEFLTHYKVVPPFRQSYDITGHGEGFLVPPELPMGYSYSHEFALERVLDIPLEEAFDSLRELLKEKMHMENQGFQSRHWDRDVHKVTRPIPKEITYASFQIGDFVISTREAQRNSARRIERFSIRPEDIKGKRVLDLGCNVGAILFEIYKWQPLEILGVEYDLQKVELARKIAALEGVQIEFMQADVDQLVCKDVGEFDVVFCLSLETHLQRPDALYPLFQRIHNETAKILRIPTY